jgi:hypothetical protein
MDRSDYQHVTVTSFRRFRFVNTVQYRFISEHIQSYGQTRGSAATTRMLAKSSDGDFPAAAVFDRAFIHNA